MNNHGRWRMGALASAIALLGSMASPQVHALALGRITVQSALGESLRAEIDISDLSAEEASSLKVGIATAEAFKSAGLDYSAAAAGLDVKLQRRADGRSFLRLSSNRAITEPFVDLILEARWASGRITRDYTMLLDPPNVRASSAPEAPFSPATAPVLSRAPAASARAPAVASIDSAPRAYSPPSPAAARPVAVAKETAIQPPAAQNKPAGARQVTVKAGDNASKIALQNKPSNVSLDQMLATLLRSNPHAFIGGNINVIKSGAVLDMPDAQSAASISAAEATTIVAQSSDFNTFRRKLAEGIRANQVDSANRQAGGKVQATVEDRAQANAPADKLTLSRGAVQGKSASGPEDQTARDQEAREASSRMAELSKNISDLNKLSAVPALPSSSAAPASAIPALPGLAIATPTLPNTDPGKPAAATENSETRLAAASEPLAAASALATPVATAVIKKPAVPTAALPEPGLFEQMNDNSLLLLGAAGLLALLGGLGFARYRSNKKAGTVDSSFLDSRVQPDSFFGASGGRSVDTSERPADGSSMAYSPSQFDTSGDVDPVAEADVYLAYGRDQQAEEILKDALRTRPARIAIQAKLLEIYAKRRDGKAFESMAAAAFKLSKGQGPEWAYISKLGRDLDPANSIYQASAGFSSAVAAKPAEALAPAGDMAAMGLPPTAADNTSPMATDFDLDLDFSLDESPVAPMTHAPATAPEAVSSGLPQAKSGAGYAVPSALLDLDDLDFSLDNSAQKRPVLAVPLSASASAPPASVAPVDSLSNALDFTPELLTVPDIATVPAVLASHSDMLEFDLGSLSLDLDTPAPAPAPSSALVEPEKDPLEVKFLLAEEFRILGDPDGARSLADEVLVKAKGPLKVKAQAFLNSLL